MRGWMASLTQWTWVWVDSGSWWWARRPGVLWFMGSQIVRHDWATEMSWLNVSQCSTYGFSHDFFILKEISHWEGQSSLVAARIRCKKKKKSENFYCHLWWLLCVLVAQLWLTLCDPMDGSLPGSSGHGILWRRKWQPILVLLAGKSHGQRSLVDYSPWGRKELGTTEWLHFHFHLQSKFSSL